MRRIILVAAVITGTIALIDCTIDVGKPDITLDCVEILFPTEHVLYCDGGIVQPPVAKDSSGN